MTWDNLSLLRLEQLPAPLRQQFWLTALSDQRLTPQQILERLTPSAPELTEAA
jgi:hypothetical protein